MNENDSNNIDGNKDKNDNNISVPKPLFALLIVVLCIAVCYSAYNAGYMKGMAVAPAGNALAESAPPANAPEADAGTQTTPADNGPAQNAPAERPDGNDFGGNGSRDPGYDLREFFRELQPFNGNKGDDRGENPDNGGNADNSGNGGNADNSGNDGNTGDNGNGNSAENTTQGAYLDIVGYTVTQEEKDSYNIPDGVLIMKVSEGGAAEKAGIVAHSVVTAVDGKTINTIEELKGTLKDKNPGDIVQITLFEPSEDHGFVQKTVSVTLSDGEAVSKER